MSAADHAVRRHLHVDDYPCTLAALAAFLDDRRLGHAYEPTDAGAWVDFDWLATASHLSTTERAAVRTIEGLAVFERHGGPPPTITIALRDLTDRVVV